MYFSLLYAILLLLALIFNGGFILSFVFIDLA